MSGTTTNNGWTYPTSTDYVKDGATAIQTAIQGVDTSVGTGLLAWTSYTPTFTSLNFGTGSTVTAKYAKLGKIVHFSIRIILGTSPSITGGGTWTLPVAKATNATLNCSVLFQQTGTGWTLGGTDIYGSGTTQYIYAVNAAGTYGAYVYITNTIPFTWLSGHEIQIAGSYEAA